MYQVFLGYVPLPIAPSKITTSINSRNRTVELIDGSEINILKDKGLTEISFDFMLPHQSYPFVTLAGSLSNAINNFLPLNMGNAAMNSAILEYLEWLKTSKKPFQLIIARMGESGGKSGLGGVLMSALNTINTYNSSVTVSLENYTIDEDADNGMDFIVSVNLKQFQTYVTTTIDGNGRVTKVRPKTSVSGDFKSTVVRA